MLLIIACGNSLRRDDGAGLLMAERLEQECQALGLIVKRISVHQLMPELAVDIADRAVRAVVFVDTRPAQPGDTAALFPLAPEEASPSIGHHLTPTVLLLYAQQLYDHCPPAWQITVPGVDFDHGETLSRTAADSLSRAPALAQQLAVLCR
ncbi:MAG: hydrogenase maturation protease [Anaerolineae bacterium]|nr:hydrogenase maturation protease [Anaerolineae bacterium]